MNDVDMVIMPIDSCYDAMSYDILDNWDLMATIYKCEVWILLDWEMDMWISVYV